MILKCASLETETNVWQIIEKWSSPPSQRATRPSCWKGNECVIDNLVESSLTQAQKNLRCPEGLSKCRTTAIASVNTSFDVHSIISGWWEATYSARKCILICFYSARLLRRTASNGCLVALNDVIFCGLFNQYANAVARYILKTEVRWGWKAK